ncbi:MAG TPA: alpha/beta hydrolase [Bacteroidia bacterium]|jgi:pimeloyl-ACP methyl ester carboxylesterase
MKKKLKRFTALTFFTALVLVLSSWGKLLQFREDDKTIIHRLKQEKADFELGYYTAIGRSIRYLIIDNHAKDNLIIIHGAPGSMSRYNKYFEDTLLRRNYNFYVIDRPGYGYSGFGDAETSIDSNVAAVRPVFNLIRNRSGKNIVVGKSYGGPIASRLAMLYPQLVDGLVLVAPAIQPGEERTYSISYLMVNDHYKYLFPSMYVTASKEKLCHKQELEKMKNDWDKIHCPVIMVQGLKDDLVYPSNIDFLKHNMNDSLLEVIPLKDETHFFSAKAYPVIVHSFLEMKEKCDANSNCR